MQDPRHPTRTVPSPSTVTRDIDVRRGPPRANAEQPGAVQATVTVGGDLSGQVAIGSDIVQMQIGTMYGNVITTAPADAAPAVTRRPRPVRLLPRAPSPFADRTSETGQVIDALLAHGAVNVTGPPGSGKSTLLRFVAHHPRLLSLPSGVVHLSAFDETPADLAQSLFDAFYETTTPYKPSIGEIRQRLHDVEAALLLDDVAWSSDESGRVLDTAPQSGFALVSEHPVLATEVRLREPPAEGPRRAPAGQLGADERRVLGALGAVPGLALDAEQLAAVTVGRLPAAELEHLAQQGLVLQRAGREGAPERFAASPAAKQAMTDDELQAAGAGLDEYFLAWALRHRHSVQAAPNDVDAALTVMTDAGRRGRWGLVIALGQAVESSLAVAGRWDAWGQVLQRLTTAAEELDADDVRAFALHQRGALAASAGDTDAATALFQDALAIRERLGDTVGADVTRTNLQQVAPPPPPPLPWGWIVVGTLLATGALLGALFATGVLPPGDSSAEPLVRVPDLLGQSGDAALEQLADLDLAGEVTTVEDDAPEGTVVDQDPDAGTQVEPASEISLLVASGDGDPTEPTEPPRDIEVPNLIGEHVDEAIAILDDVGLSAQTVTVEFADVERGIVMAHDPQAGELVEPDTTVTLTVAQPAPVTVPSVVGRLVEEAAEILGAEGLALGEVLPAEEVVIPLQELDAVFVDAGTVVHQNPAPGTAAAADTPVDVVVVPVDSAVVPFLEGRPIGEAIEELKGRNLDHERSSLPGEEATCEVASQDPGPGTIVPFGFVVLLETTPCPID